MPSPAEIKNAAEALRRGDLVAFPTETVYGLGADACNGAAVAQVYALKGRPQFNPLIAHLPDLASAARIGHLSAQAERLAAAFWPGPLTLVVPLRAESGLSGLVTAGLDSVALRVPAHPVALDLLRAFGGPLAAPSANPSGRISPTSAAHVRAGFGAEGPMVLDGGACTVGVESTILDLRAAPVLLRAGGVPAEAIAPHLDAPLTQAASGEVPVAPGQLRSHYAPRGTVRLNAQAARPGEVMVGFGAVPGDLSLSASGDLTEAAARLFDCLHQLDAMGATRIAVAPVPDQGLGMAINDRLRRAAAPRD